MPQPGILVPPSVPVLVEVVGEGVEQVMGCEVGGQKGVAVCVCGGRGVPLYSVLNDIQDLRVHSHAIAW